jgi:hypothetical protein
MLLSQGIQCQDVQAQQGITRMTVTVNQATRNLKPEVHAWVRSTKQHTSLNQRLMHGCGHPLQSDCPVTRASAPTQARYLKKKSQIKPTLNSRRAPASQGTHVTPPGLVGAQKHSRLSLGAHMHSAAAIYNIITTIYDYDYGYCYYYDYHFCYYCYYD